MGARKPQELKSLSLIKLQPKRVTSKIEAIICMDIAGRSGRDISESIGISYNRLSIIRNSPLYMNRLEQLRGEVASSFVDKRAENLSSGDPVEETFKEAAITAANKKIDLMRNSKNEFVASAAAGDILDRAGYRAHQEKTKITVEVTDKMADRFERALGYEPTNNVGKTKIRFTQEVS